MRVIPIDDRKMTLTVATPPRRQSKPNPFTGEIDWDVDVLAVTSDGKADLLRVTVPDSGLDKKVVPLVAVQVDGFIGRVWEKQDGRHGVDVRLRCHGPGRGHQRLGGEGLGGRVMTGAARPTCRCRYRCGCRSCPGWRCSALPSCSYFWCGRWWRRHHRPKISDSEASVRRWVNWVASRWMWDARNLGLVLVDDTTRHRYDWWSGRTLPPVVRIPDIRFEPAPHGLRAWMRTVPGVGLDQVTKMAGHLANAWGCLRVDVSQHAPGVLLLRGFVRDPAGHGVAGHPHRPAVGRLAAACRHRRRGQPDPPAAGQPVRDHGGRRARHRQDLAAAVVAVPAGPPPGRADRRAGRQGLQPGGRRLRAAAGPLLRRRRRRPGGRQPAARPAASDHAGPLGLAAHPSGHGPVLGGRPHRRLPAGAGLRGREPHLRDRGVPQGPRAVRQQRLVPDQAGQGRPLPGLSDRVCHPETNRRRHPHRHPRCLPGRPVASGCGPWTAPWPPWATRSASTPTSPPPT